VGLIEVDYEELPCVLTAPEAMGDGAPVLFDVINELLGSENWSAPSHWGQVMVTFPEPGAQWRLPSKQWHADWPFTSAPEPLFGLKIFAFFGAVEPRDGGTLVVAGSHRLVERFVPTAELEVRSDYRACRRRLMDHDPWLRALSRADDPDPDRNERFMSADHDADGIPVRVVELTGNDPSTIRQGVDEGIDERLIVQTVFTTGRVTRVVSLKRAQAEDRPIRLRAVVVREHWQVLPQDHTIVIIDVYALVVAVWDQTGDLHRLGTACELPEQLVAAPHSRRRGRRR
jgi:hypothetical protein